MINLTFVVQIINFWITYVVLSRVLLGPLVARFTHKKAIHKALIDNLKYKETALLHLQEKKNRQLVEFKHYLNQHYTFEPLSDDYKPTDITLHLSEEDIKACQKEAERMLEEKVPHAF